MSSSSKGGSARSIARARGGSRRHDSDSVGEHLSWKLAWATTIAALGLLAWKHIAEWRKSESERLKAELRERLEAELRAEFENERKQHIRKRVSSAPQPRKQLSFRKSNRDVASSSSSEINSSGSAGESGNQSDGSADATEPQFHQIRRRPKRLGSGSSRASLNSSHRRSKDGSTNESKPETPRQRKKSPAQIKTAPQFDAFGSATEDDRRGPQTPRVAVPIKMFKRGKNMTYEELVSVQEFTDLDVIRHERMAVVERHRKFHTEFDRAVHLSAEQEAASRIASRIEEFWLRRRVIDAINSPIEHRHRGQAGFELESFPSNSSIPTTPPGSSEHLPPQTPGEKLDKAKDVISRCKIDNLVQFAFQDGRSAYGDDDEDAAEEGLARFDDYELRCVFNSFGLFGSQRNMIRVYEESRNIQFLRNTWIRESYAMALIRTGRSSKGVKVLKQVLEEVGGSATMQAWNFLGDAYNSMRKAASELLKVLRRIKHRMRREGVARMKNANPKERAVVEAYYREFGDREHLRRHNKGNSQAVLPSLESVEIREAESRVNALEAYDQAFRSNQDFNPLLRTMTIMVEERSTSSNSGVSDEEIARIDKRIKTLSRLVEFGIQRDGGAHSGDYWCHSGRLEALCFRQVSLEEMMPVVLSVLKYARNSSQLEITVNRLECVANAYHNENIYKVIRILEDSAKLLEVSGQAPDPDSEEYASLRAFADEELSEEDFELKKATNHFLKYTYSARGYLANPRPVYLPGSANLSGKTSLHGVQEMIFSQSDARVFEELLKKWEIEDFVDSRSFLKLVIPRLRNCFFTHKLVNISDNPSSMFNVVIDGVLELMGVAKHLRDEGDPSLAVSNASSALLFFGDAKVHTQELLCFFQFWQSRLLNQYLLEAYQRLESGSPEDYRRIEQIEELEVPFLLQEQLRGAHVGIYAPVQMESKGVITGSSCSLDGHDTFIPLERVYGLEQFQSGEPLRHYEAQYSMLLVRYRDEPDFRAIFPSLHKDDGDDKGHWGIPCRDGVPVLERAEDIVDIRLYNLIEEHTMTFLMDSSTGLIERMDAFHNEQFNTSDLPAHEKTPYEFGSGQCDLMDLATLDSLDGGKLRVRDAEGTIKDVNVRLRLLQMRQTGSNSPAVAESMDDTKFYGMALRDINVADELEKEDTARKLDSLSVRDRFFQRLKEWQKARRRKNTEHDLLIGQDPVPPPLHLLRAKPEKPEPASMSSDEIPPWEIDFADIHIGARVGKGGFGEVYRGKWLHSEVAVKKFFDQDVDIKEMGAEVETLRNLRHPNVVLFMGACTKPPNICIVTEFLPRGSLYRVLRSNIKIDDARRLQMATDIAVGMNYLHSGKPPLVHRDLKTQNLLVDKNFRVKVGDFGLARVMPNTYVTTANMGAGTPAYQAPEIMRTEHFDSKVDVYSFGIILWELLTRESPYAGLSPIQIVSWVGFQNNRPKIPPDCDPDYEDLIQRCWDEKASKRPTFSEVVDRLSKMTAKLAPVETKKNAFATPLTSES